MNSPMDDGPRQADDGPRLAIDALLDGALPDAQAAALRERMQGDAALRAEYERRRQVVELVRALPAARVPDGFAAAILKRLSERTPATAPSPERHTRPGRILSLWLWGSGLAAAAALVVAVSLSEGDPAPGDDWTLATDAARSKEREQGASFGVSSEQRDKIESRVDGGGEHEARSGDRAALQESDEAERSEQMGLVEGKSESGDDASRTLRRLEQDEAERAARAKDADDARARKMAQPELAKKTAVEQTVLLRVEQDRTVLSATERGSYLATLGRESDAVLRAHLDRVGKNARDIAVLRAGEKAPQAPRGAAKGDAASGGPAAEAGRVTFDFVVEKRSDADALRKILKRAFPPAAPPSPESKSSLTAMPRPVTASLEERGEGGVVTLDWLATAHQAGTMARWFQRIGLRRAAGSQHPVRVGVTALAAAEPSSESAESTAVPVPVRVHIRFGHQPRTPERPAGEDR